MEALFGIGYIIWSLIGLVIWLAVLGWVYTDASEKGHGGCLWLLLVLVFHFLALGIYLIFFHGVTATSRHRATDRNADLRFRSIYRPESAPAQTRRAESGQSGYSTPVSRGLKADPDFFDPDLDRLIASGKFSEARSLLRDMLSVAREMDDSTTIANYRQYENRITQASNKWMGERSPERY